jgi:hypothetical protein
MSATGKVRLEGRLQDTEPKCATCAFWDVRRGDEYSELITAGQCNRNDVRTLNLSVCTGWHDAESEQEILER